MVSPSKDSDGEVLIVSMSSDVPTVAFFTRILPFVSLSVNQPWSSTPFEVTEMREAFRAKDSGGGTPVRVLLTPFDPPGSTKSVTLI